MFKTLFSNIGVRLISDIYRQFFLFGFTQWFRSFCADRKARLSERNASLLANCRAWVLYPKNQRALRMGAFLTAAEADDFWGCGTRSLKQSFASRKFGCSRHSANEFALCSRLHKLSPLSKSHWRRLPKSLMRINEPINEKRGLVLTWIFNLKQFK